MAWSLVQTAGLAVLMAVCAASGQLAGVVQPELPGGGRPRFDVSAPPPVIAVPSTRPSRDAAATLTSGRAKELLDGLASPEPSVRERSGEALMDLSLADLDVLREAVREAAPLVPQVQPLLRDAVTHVYLRYRVYDAQPDVAFLGITLSPISLAASRGVPGSAPPPVEGIDEGLVGISVTSRMPGLAGFRYLQDGDVIVSVGTSAPRVESFGFRSTEDFSGQIRGRRPGDRVVLGVLRSGRLVRVEAELSPRPVRMEEFNSLESLRSERLTAARDYWDGSWLPLVEPLAVSGPAAPRGEAGGPGAAPP